MSRISVWGWRLVSTGSEYGPVAGCFENGDELLISIKAWCFLHQSTNQTSVSQEGLNSMQLGSISISYLCPTQVLCYNVQEWNWALFKFFESGTITHSGVNITGRRAVWTLEQSCSMSELSAALLLHRLDSVPQRPALVWDAGLLARSQYPEGPATGHLDTGFALFPCA